MTEERTPNLVLENAKLLRGNYRNFAGRSGKYNAKGTRNFCVVIEGDELARQLHEDGWNIHTRAPRDPDDTPLHYLKVKVAFDEERPSRDPVIKIKSERGKRWTRLDAESVEELDSAVIVNADVSIRPWHYDVNGSTGISAYLKTLYVITEEDEFAYKYAEEEYPEE